MFIARRHASRLLVVLGCPTARLPGCLAVRPPGCHAARLPGPAWPGPAWPGPAWPGPAPSQHKIYDPGVCDSRSEVGVAKVDAEPLKVVWLFVCCTSFKAQPTSFATPVFNLESQTWASQNLPWGPSLATNPGEGGGSPPLILFPRNQHFQNAGRWARSQGPRPAF